MPHAVLSSWGCVRVRSRKRSPKRSLGSRRWDGLVRPLVPCKAALLRKRRKGYTPSSFARYWRRIVVPGKEPDGFHRYVSGLCLISTAAPHASAAPANPGRAASVGRCGQLLVLARHSDVGTTATDHPCTSPWGRRDHHRG